MKKIYLKQLLAAILLLCSTVVSAYDFEYSGIYYTLLSESEVKVTRGDAPYSGAVVIPSKALGPVNIEGELVTKYCDVIGIDKNAFLNCTELTSITIPGSVTSIGDFAFNGCTGLTELVIANEATPLLLGCHTGRVAPYTGKGLFNDCPLENVHIGRILTYNEINTRGYSPFYNNATIKSVTFGKDVTSIGGYMFKGCSGIEELILPEDLTSIGYCAFEYCSNIGNKVIIPNSVTSIAARAFYGCSKMPEITILGTIQSIGEQTFQGCSSLTKLIIPEGVTTIGEMAFNYCTALESITIPGSVTSIGNFAFDYCENLKELHLADGKEALYMGRGVYGNQRTLSLFFSSPLETIYLGRDITFPSSGEPFEGKATITKVTIGDMVTNIPYRAFQSCGITSIAIPDGVKTIETYAFYNCAGITSATIGKGVTTIGNNAFNGCTNIAEVNIEDIAAWCNINFATATSTPTYYSKKLYLNDELITDLVIPEETATIGAYAFYNCTGITSVEIHNNVKSIGTEAFNGCTNITKVNIEDIAAWCNINFATATSTPTYYSKKLYLNDELITDLVIPEETTTIGAYAFYNCTGITSVEVPNSVTNIETDAFACCSKLTNVTLPNSVTEIGKGAFWHCTNLTNIEIPNSVTSIGSDAFAACNTLTSITIPNSVTTIGNNTFNSCSSLANVTIGNSVESIGDYAFYNCKLSKITFPSSITSLGYKAFYGNPLKEVNTTDIAAWCNIKFNDYQCNPTYYTYKLHINGELVTDLAIPGGVTTIGKLAFLYCFNLKSVTIPNSVKSIEELAFYGINDIKIYFASNPTIGSSAINASVTRHLTLTDSDAADFNNANSNTYADVSYTRTISEGKYGTIMLPFAPDEASLQNYAFYTLKEAGDGYIKFEEVAAPVANTPYLYTLREGGENVAITAGKTTIAADINNCNVDGWDLVGSFTKQTIDCTDGNYYAYSAARNEINRITKTLTVRPYRAYLTSTAAQNSNLRVFIGGTTGVTEISPDDIEGFGSGAVYDLYGRPVNEPDKGGIYIIDGKKVVW